MPHGLPRNIRIAFILRLALASLAVIATVLIASTVVKHSLIHTLLQEEALHYWELYASSPAQPPPNTRGLRGYLVLRGQSELSLPEELRGLGPGLHSIGRELVLVDERAPGRLYLLWLGPQAERLFFWSGTLPLLLCLAVLYGASYITYRFFRRLVSPVSWLARQVAQWDPREPDTSALAPDRLPKEVQGEARQLAEALHGLSQRVATQVARERDFTRDASHELRTPLTVIRVASDLALAGDLPPRAVRSLQRIQRSSREMEAVIDAFLILAREADIEPQSEDFDVAEIVLDEAQSARDLLVGKPVELTVVCNAKPRLHAPPRVMHVVVSNLLRNACSYTDEGRIEVTVDSDQLVVRDSGIGMTTDAMRRAFEPFYRVDESRQHSTGLGLSIVHRLCQRFGWKVELDSVLGQGTTATVRFVP
ncbi:sensor histidine kinase [Pseudoxanthomonas spadix]|uniref:histidine kinase n=1 Tax=Pseudoxanthomonas spadix (strain BD-a59) TaxID=1045855 RepID=G7UQB2_PSEUP|nr:HAMP domain-containing sensor histidine kinase [Pseudoxanthomonas spadix]AER55724.1 integral membrane sensor signal transduction histidine kinase [Pseudoxanthomonas spadix BD-a59]MBP3973572.1 HAMP domain-containing histidine kinase [Pseudoxanthomonas spadix]RMW94950.1 sensor histidine kinase [Pseudoxanthomonas spadix]